MRPSLLRNNGDGTFTDVTEEAGLLRPGQLRSPPRWADYDNDGWLDLFVCCETQPNRLYRNRGRRHLRGGRRQGRRAGRTTASARGPPGSTSTTTAIPTCSSTTSSGDAPQLFRNNRDGTFTDVTTRHGHRRAAVAASRAGPGTTTTTAGSTSSPPATTAPLRRRRQGPAGPAARPALQQALPQPAAARGSRT